MKRKISEATEAYEAWLGSQLRISEEDLRVKHGKMAADPFQFLRATYYRWAEVFPLECPELTDHPVVHSVGDLHVQNFGTWRDAEGRLVWGINDFDEADSLPFTSDLVRLAVSAHLAVQYGKGVEFTPAEIGRAILAGYRKALEQGGMPFVLEGEHQWLLDLANAALDPGKFWKKWLKEKSSPIKDEAALPVEARHALIAAFRQVPDAELGRIEWRQRGDEPKGLGGLGRLRFFGYLADWKGGPLVREAKAAAPPATRSFQQGSAGAIAFPQIVEAAVRSADPFFRLAGSWVVRPVAADAGRIDFDDIKGGVHETALLHAMGCETANIHLGTSSDSADTLIEALQSFRESTLHEATHRMLESITEDFEQWRVYHSSGT